MYAERATFLWSGDEFAYYVPADVGEPKVAALEAVGEFGVVEAEEVQEGGVEVVDVDGVFDDVPADLVRFSDDLAAFDAAAGHPDGERKGMMVATGDFGVAFAVLAKGRAAEFRTPHDERG